VELPLCVFGIVERDKVKEFQVMGWVLVCFLEMTTWHMELWILGML